MWGQLFHFLAWYSFHGDHLVVMKMSKLICIKASGDTRTQQVLLAVISMMDHTAQIESGLQQP